MTLQVMHVTRAIDLQMYAICLHTTGLPERQETHPNPPASKCALYGSYTKCTAGLVLASNHSTIIKAEELHRLHRGASPINANRLRFS